MPSRKNLHPVRQQLDKTLRRVAEGMDCVLVYGLVSRESLEKMVHDRALTLVTGRMDHIKETMTIEDLIDRMPRISGTNPIISWLPNQPLNFAYHPTAHIPLPPQRISVILAN